MFLDIEIFVYLVLIVLLVRMAVRQRRLGREMRSTLQTWQEGARKFDEAVKESNRMLRKYVKRADELETEVKRASTTSEDGVV